MNTTPIWILIAVICWCFGHDVGHARGKKAGKQEVEARIMKRHEARRRLGLRWAGSVHTKREDARTAGGSSQHPLSEANCKG